MIKKLRIKLILLTMVSVTLVLAIIMTSVNLSNYITTTNDIDFVMDRLIENGGDFERFKPKEFDDDFDDDDFPFPNGMGRETAFETRFFSVEFIYNTGAVVSNLKNISIDEEEAIALATSVLSKERGYKDEYRYRVQSTNQSIKVYFVDAETRLSQFHTFLLLSTLISLGSILIVFVIIFLLSKRIVKPISDAYERQKRFITNAAHELKTPLTIISANNEMIEISNGESELTLGINKQINRMNNMVKNLSTLSKIDETANVNRINFNISDALDDLINQFDESFKDKNILIKKEVDNELIYNGDEGLIRQLFSILLDNAVKYSKSYLNIKANKLNNKILISLSNDGIKIDEGNLDRCFERFYRFDETRASSIEGSGIGLSIAKEIVSLHKGEIHAIGHLNNVFEIKIIL